MKNLLIPLFSFLIAFQSMAAPEPVASGVTYELIGTYDVAKLNTILTDDLKEFTSFPITYPPAKYDVKLYRIIYPSIIPEQQNRPTVASGLLAIPNTGKKEMPVVSYQHGTVFTKTAVPSHPEESMETQLIIANFAGQGYIVISPDYFGKGASTEKDSYLVKASTQQACLDHLKAAQAVSTHLDLTWESLFLSGWSQGGWATMVFLNKLEDVGITVTAAATASAPGDIYATINGWLHAPADNAASYIPGALALQIHACAEYRDLPGLVATLIRPEYQKASLDLYLNHITWAEASTKLPEKVSDMLNETFVNAKPGENARYWQILQDSQAYRFRSITPLRTFYGEQDEVVSPYIAQLPVGFQKAVGGAETTSVNAGTNANHRGTFVYGIKAQKQWFDELLEQ